MYASAQDKRRCLSEKLQTGDALRFPGAFSPLIALSIERLGFDGVYVSGAGLANDIGYPDIGLTTLTEVAARAGMIARSVEVPAIADIDTGFGGPANVARAVHELEAAGLAGCQIEDQCMPKRCGHLSGKQIITTAAMVDVLRVAVRARSDANFLIIARTDARESEGLQGSITRAKAYEDAGAQMIFPEALQSETEFETMRKEIKVPLVANMTEFGRSPILSYDQLRDVGYNLILYPLTALRLALKAVDEGLAYLKKAGTQEDIIPRMMTREELYQMLRYQPDRPDDYALRFGGDLNDRKQKPE